MFDSPARVGLASLGVPHDRILNVNNEEGLQTVFMEDKREVDGLNNGEDELNFQTIIEICKLSLIGFMPFFLFC